MTFSNIQEAMEYYASNLDWENDITQARNALIALRYIKLYRPSSSSHMNSTLSFSEIDSLIQKVEQRIGMVDRLSWTTARNRYL